MNQITNYNNSVNFMSVKPKLWNDTTMQRAVAKFNQKVLNTKISGNFENDMLKFVNMKNECNRILQKIIEAAKEKTISYDCAKKQIKKLNDLF